MHELSLAEDVLEIVESAAQKEHLSNIAKVTLSIGKLSCVEPTALSWALESTFTNTIANGATIEINETAAQVQCDHCQHKYAAEDLFHPCPRCNKFGFTVLSGNDMLVTALEGA